MYSMVLMMALNGGAAAPADHHGCVGGGGCAGVVYASCGGCYGGSGCHGGHRLFGGGHKLFGGGGCHGGGHRLFGGHGCSGSNGCYASSGCNGCHGGGHKLFGGLFGRHGGHGCSGSNGCYASHGCSGYHGCSGGVVISHGGYGGCNGGHGCHGGGMAVPMGTPTGKPMPAPAPEKTPKGGEGAKASTDRPATLIVSLPAEAKLTIDDNATVSTSATRVFVTPELKEGADFTYSLKAQLVRDGQTLTSVKDVTVRAGQETRITLEFPEASVASR